MLCDINFPKICKFLSYSSKSVFIAIPLDAIDHENMSSNSYEPMDNEMTLLVRGTWFLHNRYVLSKYHKYIFISSKAAIVLLFWNLAINLTYGLFFIPSGYLQILNHAASEITSIMIALTLLFSPLAGFLADVKLGRYNIAIFSLYLMLTGALCVFIVICTIVAGKANILYAVIFISLFCFLYFIGYSCYNANILQFGTDQLRDAPSQDSVLFLHWYYWLSLVGISIAQSVAVIIPDGHLIIINFEKSIFVIDKLRFSLFGLILILTVVILVISLCVTHFKQRWFLIEAGRSNPYRLVYRVIKFAWEHKIPIYRSAFTYCEDELPSRMDLGKCKYGGPFTTEQVEDVKAFLGILKVLFSIGPMFYLDSIATSSLIYHDYLRKEDMSHTNLTHPVQSALLFNGWLPSILIVVSLPIYICLIRPFVFYHIPGMFKRIGMASALLCVSFLCFFIMDITSLNQTTGVNVYSSCKVSENDTSNGLVFPPLNIHYVLQCILLALLHMLMYISVWEFICSQSPHSMKGLVFGVFYFIGGLFQCIGICFHILFSLEWKFSFISCGSGFYLVNFLIAVITFFVYVWVSRRYRYRVRDERSNEYRYAEEYYSTQQE